MAAVPDGVQGAGGGFVLPQAAANHPCVDVVALNGSRGRIQYQFGMIGISRAGRRGLVEADEYFAAARLQGGNACQQCRARHAITAANYAHRAKRAFVAVVGAGAEQAGEMLLRVGAIGGDVGRGNVEHNQSLLNKGFQAA